MNRIVRQLLPIALITAGGLGAVPINFISNGSFEADLVGDAKWQAFSALAAWGMGTLPGSVELQRAGLYGALLGNNPANNYGQSWDGHQWAELDFDFQQLGLPAQAQIFQDISGLTVGETYVLSFYWAARPTIVGSSPSQGNQALAVFWGEGPDGMAQVGNTGAPTHFDQAVEWTLFTFNVQATSTNMRVGFGSLQNLMVRNLSGNVVEAGGNLLDGVSLTASRSGPSGGGGAIEPVAPVPEPASYAFAGSGLSMLLFAARRRRRASATTGASSL